MSWQLSISLDRDDRVPLFAQIARSISDDIRRGRLKAGSRLPGSRRLAKELGVHRNTVLAAYDELVAEGWIRTEAARGSFVRSELHPIPLSRQRKPPTGMSNTLPYRLHPMDERPQRQGETPKGLLNLAGGLPDPRLVPSTEIARALGRVLRRRGRFLLSYGDPQGLPSLRKQLVSMLSQTRGVPATPDEIIVTRGSQMAIYLVTKALLGPGQIVAVEEYGYQPAWSALRSSGATLQPVPIDEEGLVVEALEAHAATGRLAAVYLTPHHQFPTTVSLSAPRRQALMDLARRHSLAIIEDDYDHEFHYRGQPVLPLASADPHGSVVHVGSLSKILAPGLRVGYVAAPTALIQRLVALRIQIDRQGDLSGEAALAELMEDGEVQRHARRVRRHYESRRDALLDALERELGDRVTVQVPAGGLALWARLETRHSVEAWARRCKDTGLHFTPGSTYHHSHRPGRHFRMGFAACTENELRRAAKIAARHLCH
jgi:GntR family transcriptional regulator/MocR family aminotransferase